MNYEHPLPTFLRQYFTASKLTGHEKALVLVALLCNGKTTESVQADTVKKAWLKGTLKVSYSSTFLARAQEHGWIKPLGKGAYAVTDAGIEYLHDIQKDGAATIPMGKSELKLFAAGETHSFDKHLRKLFASAGAHVRIADSYVDETIFDNLLDQIPKNVRVQLLYGKSFNTYDQRAKRFSTEYAKFAHKNNRSFHDRLLVIDSVGYMLGPSLKDAAHKSPASIVRLNSKDSQQLIKFFDTIWKATT